MHAAAGEINRRSCRTVSAGQVVCHHAARKTGGIRSKRKTAVLKRSFDFTEFGTVGFECRYPKGNIRLDCNGRGAAAKQHGQVSVGAMQSELGIAEMSGGIIEVGQLQQQDASAFSQRQASSDKAATVWKVEAS